jgi:uncharacterized protein (DUF1499 family)
MAAALLLAVSCCVEAGEPAMVDKPCPDRPNCVSSQAGDAGHFIEAFTFQDTPAEAMQRLREAVLGEKRMTIVEELPDYLHAEARSMFFGFVDDLEFALSADRQSIQVRSAARTGYSDFGVNRRRIERIRQAFRDLER